MTQGDPATSRTARRPRSGPDPRGILAVRCKVAVPPIAQEVATARLEPGREPRPFPTETTYELNPMRSLLFTATLLLFAAASRSASALVDTPFCFGDGTGTNCPCLNFGGPGEGCQNSTGSGGRLARVTEDMMERLKAVQVRPNNPGIFFQGNNELNSGFGNPFGDGLRCTGGSVVQLQIVVSNFIGEARTSVSVSGTGGASSGDTKYYQYWYRDPAPAGPCGSAFNLTHGLQITW